MNIAENRRNRHITVSAAGQSSRITPWIKASGKYAPGTPKSSLKTATGESLMGRAVRQAMGVGEVRIVANYETIKPIGLDPDLPRNVILEINRNITGPLGPIYLDVLKTGKQSYMVAGDIWAEFRWVDFINFHNSHANPATILLAKSVPANQGAVFTPDKAGRILSWRRANRTARDDYINIGGYIIDGDNSAMRDIVARLNATTHLEDDFNEIMIRKQLLSGYCLRDSAFNVNEGPTYLKMFAHSKGRPAVDEPEEAQRIEFIPGAP